MAAFGRGLALAGGTAGNGARLRGRDLGRKFRRVQALRALRIVKLFGLCKHVRGKAHRRQEGGIGKTDVEIVVALPHRHRQGLDEIVQPIALRPGAVALVFGASERRDIGTGVPQPDDTGVDLA